MGTRALLNQGISSHFAHHLAHKLQRSFEPSLQKQLLFSFGPPLGLYWLFPRDITNASMLNLNFCFCFPSLPTVCFPIPSSMWLGEGCAAVPFPCVSTRKNGYLISPQRWQWDKPPVATQHSQPPIRPDLTLHLSHSGFLGPNQGRESGHLPTC